jgi:multidrug efflux pump subunit AcrB
VVNGRAAVSKTRSVPSRSALSILGDQVVGKRLQRVEGVARVDISGLTVREVRIDLDPVRLRAYGVTPAEIAAALREANADQPVGLLSDPVQDALLRVEGRVRDPQAVRGQMVVARRNGLALTLADLGTLVEREKEPDSMARINGQRPSTSTSSSSRTPTSWPPATPSRRRWTRSARACRPTWSCASSTPAATGSRARSTACATR